MAKLIRLDLDFNFCNFNCTLISMLQLTIDISSMIIN